MVRVDSSVLCQTIPSGWMCVCPRPLPPSCRAQNDFFIISAALFSEMTVWSPLKNKRDRAQKKDKKDECGLMGRSLLNSISPKTGCGDPEMFLKYPSTICALC